MIKIDKFDKKILDLLQKDCKISNTKLAKEIGLTAPATLERVRKLRKNGFILEYKAILNKKKLGKGLTCFMAFNLKSDEQDNVMQRVEKRLKKIEQIEEIHLVTGRFDYLVKANFSNVDEMRKFIYEELTDIKNISKVETFLAISSSINSIINLEESDK